MRFDEVLRELNIRYQTEGKDCRPGWLQLVCPFCHGNPYLGYNLSGNYFHCWRCGPLRILDTLAEFTGQPARALRKYTEDIERDRSVTAVKRGKLVLPAGLGPLKPAHSRYLKRRGYYPKQLEHHWGIQGIAHSIRLSWRIFIPIMFEGEIVSWTTRSISNSTLRYVSASPSEELLDHKKLLYGEDYCRHAIIVHEGPFDVWRTGPGAVCTFGLGYSRAQIVRMSKYLVRVVCFDNESAAQKRARELCDMLSVFDGDTYNVVLGAKDAGEAPQKEIDRLRSEFLYRGL